MKKKQLIKVKYVSGKTVSNWWEPNDSKTIISLQCHHCYNDTNDKGDIAIKKHFPSMENSSTRRNSVTMWYFIIKHQLYCNKNKLNKRCHFND